jgi:hypothetical protein
MLAIVSVYLYLSDAADTTGHQWGCQVKQEHSLKIVLLVIFLSIHFAVARFLEPLPRSS